MFKAKTRQTQEQVCAWLDAHPEGARSKEIHAATRLCSFASMQRLLRALWREGTLAMVGAGAHMRYTLPRHQGATQVYLAEVCVARSTEQRRLMALKRAAEHAALGLALRPSGTSVELEHQPVRRSWPQITARPGPASVFDWASA
jgi:hypothetical protein